MNKISLLALAATILSATSVFAADLPKRTEVRALPVMAAQTYSWTGAYAGINLGYDFARTKATYTGTGIYAPHFASGAVPQIGKLNPMDINYGGQLGVNYQTGRIVYGFETDLSIGTHKSNDVGNGVFTGAAVPGRSESQAKVLWLGTTRARLGYAILDNLMVYATGGLAYGGVKSGYHFEGAGAGAASAVHTSTGVGYAVGAGVEYAATAAFLKGATIRAEYLHYDLGKKNVTAATSSANTTKFSNKYAGDIVRVGLNWKYDWTNPFGK